MRRRNTFYSKNINMSAMIVVRLLAISLASQTSNCQVERFPSVAVTECQFGQNLALGSVDDKVGQIPSVAQGDSQSGPWISELFYQALVNFTVRQIGSSACRAQSDMYDRHLRNHTSWAVRMAESWTRYPTGILAGNQYHMGTYDECVDVRHPVIGQYCLSEINLSSLTGKDYSFKKTNDLDDFGNKNALKTILGVYRSTPSPYVYLGQSTLDYYLLKPFQWGDHLDKVKRNRLHLGICIPDSCSALDLQTSLQNELDSVLAPEDIKAVVKVDPIMCTVKGDMYPYNTSYYRTRMFFVMLVFICCGTTLYHYMRVLYNENPKKTSEGFGSFCDTFSFIDSIKALLKFDKDNELNSLYGFKVIMMISVIMGHKLLYIFGNPTSNPKYLESAYHNGPDILLSVSNIVDPFFFISGFIMYVNISRPSKKVDAGIKKITSPIINRVLKMLPAYCAMMAITAHIVPHYGDGPLWPKIIWEESEICKNYWWTNLLFMTNFLESKYGCLIINYYASCDVQFFAVGVIIVYAYMKNSKFGIGLLGTVLALSVSVPFAVTLITKRKGIDLFYVPYIESLRTFITVNKSYRLSYMRATPFFAGLATSCIVEKLKENKVTFSRITVYGGTLIVSMICLHAQLYSVNFYSQHRPYNPLEHALYSVVIHCTWAVWGMWCSICLFTTGYGHFTYLINNRLAVVLGRLSYSVFLVNITVLMMSQATMRSPFYISGKSVVDAWIFDLVKCYVMALALHLVVEAPFNKMIKRWIG